MTKSTIAYVACGETSEILAYRIADDSSLEQLSVTTVPAHGVAAPYSMPLAVDLQRRRLYAAIRSEPFQIASFAIEDDGALTLLRMAPAPGTFGHISVHPHGQHLLGASYPSELLAVMKIEADGVSGEVSSTATGRRNPHMIIPDRQGRYVYSATVNGDTVDRWTFDPDTGTLADVASSPVAAHAGPRHLCFGHAGRVLYSINEHDASVSVFGIDQSTGKLSLRQHNMEFARENVAAADIHCGPGEHFLYISERNSGEIAVFAINPRTGRIKLESTHAVETVPRSFAITPAGEMIVLGQKSNRMSVYKLLPTGAPELVERYPTPGNPSWIEIVQL